MLKRERSPGDTHPTPTCGACRGNRETWPWSLAPGTELHRQTSPGWGWAQRDRRSQQRPEPASQTQGCVPGPQRPVQMKTQAGHTRPFHSLIIFSATTRPKDIPAKPRPQIRKPSRSRDQRRQPTTRHQQRLHSCPERETTLLCFRVSRGGTHPDPGRCPLPGLTPPSPDWLGLSLPELSVWS